MGERDVFIQIFRKYKPYEDENGELQEIALFGLECRIFQHEMDHMEGTNFTKKVSKMRLSRAKKRQQKRKKVFDKQKLA